MPGRRRHINPTTKSPYPNRWRILDVQRPIRRPTGNRGGGGGGGDDKGPCGVILILWLSGAAALAKAIVESVS